jgi:hypothetical protein
MRRRRVASVRPTVADLLARTESRTLETQSPWNPVRLIRPPTLNSPSPAAQETADTIAFDKRRRAASRSYRDVFERQRRKAETALVAAVRTIALVRRGMTGRVRWRHSKRST